MKIGITALRIVVGALFVGHGMQKLAGWFGGDGLDATAQTFEQIGLRPGRPHAFAAGVSEAGGGTLLATGLLTPLGACMTTGSMAVAIHEVHAKNGLWVTEGGFEYNAVLAAAAFAIAAEGPGPFSLDRRLGIERAGARVALAELAAALAGAALVVLRPRGGSQPASDSSSNGSAPTAEDAGHEAATRPA